MSSRRPTSVHDIGDSMRRGELTNEQWNRLKDLLPPQRPGPQGGRPPNSHRQVLNGILWRLRTGAPWEDLPARYGSWKTVYNRFNKWSKDEVFSNILNELRAMAETEGNVDWSVEFVDGTVVRAHQHSAGAQKNIRVIVRKSRLTER